MSVTLEIDELVLRGTPPGRASHEVAEALERELARLVVAGGLPYGVSELDLPALPALTIPAPGTPAELGVALAEALFSMLHARLAGPISRDDGMRSL